MDGSELFEPLGVGLGVVGAWVWANKLVLLAMFVPCTPRPSNTKFVPKKVASLGVIRAFYCIWVHFGPFGQIFPSKNSSAVVMAKKVGCGCFLCPWYP